MLQEKVFRNVKHSKIFKGLKILTISPSSRSINSVKLPLKSPKTVLEIQKTIKGFVVTTNNKSYLIHILFCCCIYTELV